jgi:hypothetical protein
VFEVEKGSVLGSAEVHADLGAVRLCLRLLHMLYVVYTLLVHLQYTACTAMSTTPRQLTIRLPQVELDRIEAYSKRTGRTKTDILREFIRSLPEPELEPESKPEKKSKKK